MNSDGTERRRHRIIVTRNTEYHLRDNVCVAVRDRQTKRWAEGHLAVNRTVEGGVRFFDNGAVVPNMDPPRQGDAIFFSYKTEAGNSRQLITSRIEDVQRTPKRDVLAYATMGIKRVPNTGNSQRRPEQKSS